MRVSLSRCVSVSVTTIYLFLAGKAGNQQRFVSAPTRLLRDAANICDMYKEVEGALQPTLSSCFQVEVPEEKNNNGHCE